MIVYTNWHIKNYSCRRDGKGIVLLKGEKLSRCLRSPEWIRCDSKLIRIKPLLWYLSVEHEKGIDKLNIQEITELLKPFVVNNSVSKLAIAANEHMNNNQVFWYYAKFENCSRMDAEDIGRAHILKYLNADFE